MATESGYSNQKKLGPAQYKTIQNVGSDKFGVNTAQMYLFDVTPASIAITNVAIDPTNSNKVWLEIIGHGARSGDVVRFINSANALYGWELEIIEVLDANTLAIHKLPKTLPVIGDQIKVCRWITAKADAEGALTTTSGPVQFILNGSTATVNEDTVTPSNSLALPVKLMGTTGPINITAGDLNVQMTDLGANFDALRIGDGSGKYVGVTPNDEAKTHDADAITQLTSINTKTPALVSGKVPVDTGFTQPLTDAQLRTTPVNVLGPLTNAELRAAPVPTTGPLTNAELRGAAVPVTGPLTDTQLRASAVSIAALQLPATLGQKTAPNSLSVVLASGSAIDATIAGGATEAKQDAQQLNLVDIKNNTAAEVTAVNNMSAKLPATLGTKTAANSMSVTLASDSSALPTTQAAMTASYQEIVNLTTTAQTLTAPVGAKWCKIMADADNSANIRVKMGGAATASSGMRFEPGRSEDYSAVGNISVIAESGTNQKIYFQFGA